VIVVGLAGVPAYSFTNVKLMKRKIIVPHVFVAGSSRRAGLETVIALWG
jgi:hypothetical protein